MPKKTIIYTDGGSRGNPGPSAIGYVIDGVGHGEYIGQATNNIAEYTALLRALQKVYGVAKQSSSKIHLDVRMDSELIVKQMKGIYRIKNKGLKPLFIDIQNLIGLFASVVFTHVRREMNKHADAMVNDALDARFDLSRVKKEPRA